jgi:hypothetical protein
MSTGRDADPVRFFASDRRQPAVQKGIDRKPVLILRHRKDKQDKDQTRDDVLVKGLQRIVQEVAERDDEQHESQRD